MSGATGSTSWRAKPQVLSVHRVVMCVYCSKRTVDDELLLDVVVVVEVDVDVVVLVLVLVVVIVDELVVVVELLLVLEVVLVEVDVLCGQNVHRNGGAGGASIRRVSVGVATAASIIDKVARVMNMPSPLFLCVCLSLCVCVSLSLIPT